MRVAFPPQKAFLVAQQDRIDQQKHLIRKPMLEQRRSQRELPQRIRSAPSFALMPRTPSTRHTSWPHSVCRHRTLRCLRPETRPEIVGSAAKQRIEALAVCRKDCRRPSRAAIGCGPVAVGVVVVFTRAVNLDYGVHRDVFENFEFFSLRVSMAK
jgi:hypothetical protein